MPLLTPVCVALHVLHIQFTSLETLHHALFQLKFTVARTVQWEVRPVSLSPKWLIVEM